MKDEGLPKERTFTTVGHGAFSSQFDGAPNLRKLYEDPDQKVECRMMFACLARVPNVLRMGEKDTTIHGLLKQLLLLERHLLNDVAWSFGTGTK